MRVQHRYQWLYVYGFACPESGATHWLLLPTISIEIFAIALAHFAQAIGAGPDRRIILVLDRAGWHSSQTLVIPIWHPSCVSATLLTGVAALRAPLATLQRSYRQSSLRDAG